MFSIILIFICGLFVGSFLNVLVDRLPKGKSVIGGRSHCDHCKKKIAWYDLIPVLSFFLLKGKCRYCHTSLSFYYPVIEMTTGIMFVATTFFVLNNFQFSIFNFQSNLNFQLQQIPTLFYYLFIVSSLIVIFFADLKYGIIPDKVIFPSIVIAFLYLLLNTYYIIPFFFAGIGAFAFFFLLFIVTRGKGMGFGDVKFAFLMGLILGFPNTAIALYIAFLTGALIGCILIVWKRKKLAGTKIPFGPFLVFGTIAGLFFGDRIMQLVIRFLFPL